MQSPTTRLVPFLRVLFECSFPLPISNHAGGDHLLWHDGDESGVLPDQH